MPQSISTSNREKHSNASPVLPDARVCRTRPIEAVESLSICRVKRPAHCPYVICYGNDCLCHHPYRKWFLRAFN